MKKLFKDRNINDKVITTFYVCIVVKRSFATGEELIAACGYKVETNGVTRPCHLNLLLP